VPWHNSSQTHENLAFQVRVGPLEDRDYYAKLIFEFPPDYPKVLPKINILEIQPKDDGIKERVEHIVATFPKRHQGSEVVHEITTAIMDFLDQRSADKATKKAELSLEEERARREAQARKQLQEKAESERRRREEEADENDQQLYSKVESEYQRRQKTNLSRSTTGEDGTELHDCPEEVVRFDQTMAVADTASGAPFRFKAVSGRNIIFNRKDKKITIVSPRVDTAKVQAPQLLLKDIYLPETAESRLSMQKCMEIIESDLEFSKTNHHGNVVDVINYKIDHLGLEDGTGVWTLSILTEFADRGSLDQLLEITGPLPPAKLRAWTRELIDALAFFDKHDYVHPAVHAGNVMLFMSSRRGITVKLADGYGTQLRELVHMARAQSHEESFDPSLWNWRAPELNLSEPIRTSKTCIWELGVVVLQMAFGKAVISEHDSLEDVIEEADFTKSAESLLEDMFRQNMSRRLAAYQLTNKKFFFEENSDVFRVQAQNLPHTPGRTRRYSDRAGDSRYHKDWDELTTLGKGGFGKVVMAKNKLDGQVYAIKQLKSESSKALEEIAREVSTLAMLSHPNVVRYFGAWFESEQDNEADESHHHRPQHQQPVTRPITHTGAVSTGHDFLEPSVYGNQGAEFTDSDDDDGGNMFGYQSPPALDDADGYDDDDENPFGSDPEPDRQGQEDISDPFERSAAVDDQPTDDPDLFRSGDSPVESMPFIPDPARLFPRKEIATLFIQMEYCDGQTLRSRIIAGLPKDIETGWKLFRRILEGLDYIHKNGVVHRDLKPENIFLDAHGIPKIGDFGLAGYGKATAGQEPQRPAMTTTRQSYQIGTAGYMPPELAVANSKYDSRSDMYSLGVTFFEMCFAITTASERQHWLMTALKLNPPHLPKIFEDERLEKQRAIILQLVDPDVTVRPTAAALLQSGLVPEPLEEEKFQRYIERMTTEDPREYRALIDRLMANPNDKVSSLAWEDKSGAANTAVDPMLWMSTCDQLKTIFRRHGATEIGRQAIVPKANFYRNAVTFLDTSGLVVQLPYDLTFPFARTLAQTSPAYGKSYCFGSVYRPSVPGSQPKQFPEVDFDYVSSATKDLALKEAEVLKVLDEILSGFHALSAHKWTIILNHGDLLDLILDFCRVKPLEAANVKHVLSHLNTQGHVWSKVREELRSPANNVPETTVTDLQRFSLEGDLKQVRPKLMKLFGQSDHWHRASPLLMHLEEVVSYLQPMGVSAQVIIAPLSNNSEYLYRGSLLFQCAESATRKVIAVGGRYDSLVQTYQTKSDRGSVRAAGFRLNILDLIGYHNRGSQSSGTKSSKMTSSAAESKAVTRRADVLVTSFDSNALKSSCLEVLSMLWAAGLSAELSEEVRAVEELERAYGSQNAGGYWLVMVRGGTLGERTLKVRGPSRSEDEVKAADLVGFLRLMMARAR
jgi:eukaryotic translation initiation factor 2-alpha kinase 4